MYCINWCSPICALKYFTQDGLQFLNISSKGLFSRLPRAEDVMILSPSFSCIYRYNDLFVGLGLIGSKRHEEIRFSDYFFIVGICVCIGANKATRPAHNGLRCS